MKVSGPNVDILLSLRSRCRSPWSPDRLSFFSQVNLFSLKSLKQLIINCGNCSLMIVIHNKIHLTASVVLPFLPMNYLQFFQYYSHWDSYFLMIASHKAIVVQLFESDSHPNICFCVWWNKTKITIISIIHFSCKYVGVKHTNAEVYQDHKRMHQISS